MCTTGIQPCAKVVDQFLREIVFFIKKGYTLL